MKNLLRSLAAGLGLAVAWSFTRAADDATPAVKSEKKELRVIASSDQNPPRPGRGSVLRRLAGPGEKENVTYLGVETSPVSPTLVAQLGLTDGAGLVVNRVVPDSPAAGALKEHDILLKLDDQILIEQRQLSVLIRNHKEGDEVTLTYLRAGKQATARVKLAKHEVPKMSLLAPQPGGGFGAFAFGPGAEQGSYHVQPFPFDAGRSKEETDRLLGLMDRGLLHPGMQQLRIFGPPGPGDRSVSVTVNTGNSHVVLDDDAGSLDLTVKDGKKELVAKNADGKQVFAGPVNTPEERKALPPEVRARLEKLEDSTQFNFRTGGDFEGAEQRVFRPRGQSIGVPPAMNPSSGPQPASPARRSALFL